jgi:hypothetical protein
MAVIILRDDVDVTIVDHGYQIYIDTTSPDIVSKKYSTFVQIYNPKEDDIFTKKIPGVSDNIKRKLSASDVEKRFLHSINKSKSEDIKKLSEELKFTFVSETKDERTVLIDSPNVKVIEYSDKSIAIFPSTMEITKKLEEYEESKTVKNLWLTGPNFKRTKGFILAKSSRKYKEILSFLEGSASGAGAKSFISKDEKMEGNGMEKIGDAAGQNQKVKIWGSLKFITSKIDEIDEQESICYSILERKDLDEFRKVFVIEIKDKV